ncbi:tenascin C [Heterostelium album PN500]|uniref:Tenascin C n=1 Tax=Heterostelium pallidum (strain ATCC 26659 / Pp 5 / PN500) TaxID=670386 RepID=D3B737_HETP5|nr:tenascin C [Heterostelium album PN500]EFA82580.1 tenascin C [Heterostelium album PN500]|eukprot:XP_020434697.1 tenascin C [Heterostelium album PN500]
MFKDKSLIFIILCTLLLLLLFNNVNCQINFASITPTQLPLEGGIISIQGGIFTSAELSTLFYFHDAIGLISLQTTNNVVKSTTLMTTVVPNVTKEYVGLTAKINYTEYPSLTLSLLNFTVTNVKQNYFNVELIGTNFKLYDSGWTISLGGVTQSGVNCVNQTYCSFSIAPGSANNNFYIKSSSQLAVYSNPTKTWTPLIYSLSNTTVTSDSVIVLNGLFINPTTQATVLYGGTIQLNVQYINSSVIQISNFPKVVGSATVSIFNTFLSPSNTIIVTYPPPEIYTVTLDNSGLLVITGNYFRDFENNPNLPTITGLLSTTLQLSTDQVEYSRINFTLPLDSKSGKITLSVVEPNVTKVSRIPLEGGLVYINGYFLSPQSNDGNNVLDITIGSEPCINITRIGTLYNPYTISCVAPPGHGLKSLKINSLGTEVQYDVYYKMEIYSVSSRMVNNSGLVTIFGDGFEQGTNVTIGNRECTNPQVPTPKEMVCYLQSTAGGNVDNAMSVNITLNGESVTLDLFMYEAEVKCPDCGVNGHCQNSTGECNCLEGWAGMNCDMKVDKDSKFIKPSIDKITSNIQEVDNIKITITELREVAPDNSIVNRYTFDKINWILATPSNGSFYSYNGVVSDNLFAIQVNITVFNQDSTYNFMGDIMEMKENSLKYKISISNWNFKDRLNILLMLFLSQTTASECSVAPQQQSNVDNSVRRMQMYTGTTMMSAYFSDRMLSDGRLVRANVYMTDPNDIAYKELKETSPDLVNQLMSISIQNFENTTVIDPNFGALLAINENNDNRCGSSEERKWLLPVIVIASVVGALAIVITVFLVLKKKYHVQYKIVTIGIVNPANGHSYTFATNTYTFDEAIAFSKQSLGVLNGHILQLEDSAESKFILDNFISQITPDTYSTVWLNAKALDGLQMEYGWLNGTTRGQPFYQTFPERCLKYCGDFAGNMNLSTPYLALDIVTVQGGSSYVRWRPASPTDKFQLIIEFEPADYHMISQQEPGSQSFVITFPFLDTGSRIIYINGYTCYIDTTNGNSYYCSISPQYSIGGMSFPIVISTNGVNATYSYSYNNPQVQAIRIPALGVGNTYCTIIGNSFNFLSGCMLSINGGPLMTIPSSNAQSISLVVGVDILPMLFSCPDINIEYYVRRPAVLEPSTSLHYAYLPFPVTYSDALTMSTTYKLLNENGYIAQINNTQTLNFINTVFTNNNPNFSIWSAVTYVNNIYYYNQQPLQTAFELVAGSGAQYSFTGSNQMTTPTSQNKLPLLVVFGVQTPTFNATATASVPIQGGPTTIKMLSNYGWKDTPVTITAQPNIVLQSTLSYSGASISFQAPSGYNKLSLVVYLEKIGYRTSFNYNIIYQTPVINNVVVNTTGLTISITGTGFVSPIRCDSFDISFTSVSPITVTGIFTSSALQHIYPNFFLTTAAGNSTVFPLDLTTFYITSISPNVLPRDGGEITVNGYRFSKNIDANSKVTFPNGVECSGITLSPDTTSFTCTVGISPNNGTYDIQVKGKTIAGNSNTASVTFTDFVVSDLEQNGRSVTILGSSFKLYSQLPGFTIKVGSGIPSSISCPPTLQICSFTLNTLVTNGPVFIGTPAFNVSINRVWNPIISITPSDILDPEVTSTINGLLFGDQTLVAKLNGTTYPITITSSSSGTFKPPKLTGKVTFQLVGQGFSNVIQMKFPSPSIVNLVLDQSSLTCQIYGNYFGSSNDLINIQGITAQPIKATSSNYTNISFKVPLSARTGPLNVSVNGDVSLSKFFMIEPSPTTYTPLRFLGGKLTITGQFLAPINFANENILNISVGGVPSQISLMDNNFDPYRLIVDSPPGYGTSNFTIQQYNAKITRDLVFSPPSITSCSSTVYLKPDTVTIVGDNFGSFNLSVTIGNQTCENPTINLIGSQITCKFSSNISSTELLSVRVNVANQFDQKNAFMYLIPSDCNKCSSNGKCNIATGVCECNEGWIGMDCSKIVSKTTTPVNPPTVVDNTTSVELGTTKKDITFNVNITEIREITDLGDTVKQYFIKDIKWFDVQQTNNSYTYSGRFKNDDKLQVDIIMQMFVNDTEYNFAGDIFSIPANSVKYQVHLYNWTFSDKLNSLQVLFLTQAQLQVQQGCQTQQSGIGDTSSNTESSLRMMEINQGNGILQAYYSDRMVVDGRIRNSKVSMINSTDDSVKQINSLYPNNLNILTAITIEHFDNDAIVDPNFGSLLIQDDDNPEECGSNDDKKWRLPVIIVCSVVGGLACLITVGILFKKKFRYQFKLASIKLNSIGGKSRK